MKSASQNCGFHASWVGLVEWQLKSWHSHLIVVCRWFFFHLNCTPAWQTSQNWGFSFPTQCSDRCRFLRHSDCTTSTYGCLYLTWTYPLKLSLHFLQVPLVGMIPISCSRVMVDIMMIIFWVARKGACCSQNCLLLTESVQSLFPHIVVLPILLLLHFPLFLLLLLFLIMNICSRGSGTSCSRTTPRARRPAGRKWCCSWSFTGCFR